MSRKKQTYQLVKAMSRGEKRFFTLYVSKYSKKKNNNNNSQPKGEQQNDGQKQEETSKVEEN